MKPLLRHIAIGMLASAVLVTAQGTQTPAKQNLVLIMNEQQTLTPGYPVGNLAIGDPKIADFKVMPGRRELLLLGKGIGQTTLMVWDQSNVKRLEILVNVTTREAQNTEIELRALLKDFPSVGLTTLAGTMVVSGAVSSKDDLTAIEKIAAAAKVKSVVRYVAPEATAATFGGGPVAPGGSAPRMGGGVPGGVAIPRVRYDIELLEASNKFRSGSYARGIEPSGRSLFKGVVDTDLNQETEIFIGGAVAGSPAEQSGIRLKLRPTALDNQGRFKSLILVETNLPIGSQTYDPTIWRRARWEFMATSGEPFGITGGDLMATPDMASSSSSSGAIGSATRTASQATRIPGVGNAPGAQYVPVLGSLFGSNAYKQKQTQLLVILRPRFINPAQ